MLFCTVCAGNVYQVRGSNQDFVLFVHLSLWGTTLLWHTFVLFVHLLVWHIIVLFVPFSLCGTHLCCCRLFLVWHNRSVVHTYAVCPPPCVAYFFAAYPLFLVWHKFAPFVHFPCMAQPLCATYLCCLSTFLCDIYLCCLSAFLCVAQPVCDTHLCRSSIFPCMAQPLCDILELLVNLLVWHILCCLSTAPCSVQPLMAHICANRSV